MHIAAFDWISGLAGGVLIGTATALLLWINGRVAGISGIIGGLFAPQPGEITWRVAFAAGLMLGGLIYLLTAPAGLHPVISAKWPVLIFSGLLVGFGTRLGSGCTSGHGVCGLSRFSRRSISATLVFMSVAFITVFVVRHLLGIRP